MWEILVKLSFVVIFKYITKLLSPDLVGNAYSLFLSQTSEQIFRDPLWPTKM